MAENQYMKADLLLLLVTILAALGWLFSKEALAGMPPLLFIGVRFFLASCVLCVAGRNHWAGLSASDFRLSARVGVPLRVMVSP